MHDPEQRSPGTTGRVTRDPGGQQGAGAASERTPAVAEVTQPGRPPAVAWWRIAVIGAVALAVALGLLDVLHLLARPLALLFLGIVIAETFVPVVVALERVVSRGLAVGIVYAVLVAAATGIGWLVTPPLARQAQELVLNGPTLVERSTRWADRWSPGGGDRIITAVEERLSQFGSILVDLPFTILSSLLEIVLVVFLSAYWLLLRPAMGRFVRSLFPERRHAELDDLGSDLSQAVGGYFRAEGITAAIVATIAFVGLSVIGVEYALVLSLIVAIGELVPVVGPLVAAIPALVVAFLDSPTQALIVLVFYVLVQQLESNVLVPQIMRRQVHLSPVLVLVALYSGGALGGILGAIIAVPLAGAARVMIVRYGVPAVRRWTGAAVD